MEMLDDCKFYGFHRCMALTELLCKKGECSFYKPKNGDKKPIDKDDEQWYNSIRDRR